MGLMPSTGEHEVIYQEMIDLLRRHESVPAIEMLAIASNMVGKILALQDRSTTVAEAMEVVHHNIALGNREAALRGAWLMNWRGWLGLSPVPGNLVTYRDLKRLGACGRQLRLFREMFGRKLLVTEAVAREHGTFFDLTWASAKLLTREGRVQFDVWDRAAWKNHRRDSYRRARAVKIAELLATHRKRA